MSLSFAGNTEAERVIKLVKYTNKSVFLTGNAGTGKSTLLEHIIEDIDKKYILLAPTGISALNIGGQTIHSFFGFGFRPYLPNDRDLPKLFRKVGLLKKLDLIVIDEVSMVRADVMNAIDLTLKKYLDNDLPFGGKQMLLVGDLLQLPPVLNHRNSEEVHILKQGYSSEFFFSAKVFDNYSIETIELQKIYRQEEANFIEVLNNIRVNKVDDEDLRRINSRVEPPEYIDADGVIVLTTKNATVDRINTMKLKQLDAPIHRFEAKKTGTFIQAHSTKRGPTDQILKLKEGAQVMFIKNDPDRKYVNGTIGHIAAIDDRGIQVSVHGDNFYIKQDVWEDVEFTWDKVDDKVEKKVVGTFQQYPIRLAWAITIHKSQGQTFERSIIDLDSGAFAFGQTYVALSRCTSLAGITLTRAVNRTDIKVSQNAVDYLTEQGIIR